MCTFESAKDDNYFEGESISMNKREVRVKKNLRMDKFRIIGTKDEFRIRRERILEKDSYNLEIDRDREIK